MDKEKIIKGLEHCIRESEHIDDNPCDGCPYFVSDQYGCERTQMEKDALALLKEQEAKPVIVTTNAYGTRFYHCPRCNRDLYAYPRQLYCSNCGQAVKWE